MSAWVKNAIGLAFVVILLIFAWRFLKGDSGELTIMESGVKINPRPAGTEVINSDNGKDTKPNSVAPTRVKACRISANGIEGWEKTESWTADSDWRKGGSSPGEFCGGQKLVREAQYPDRKVVLLRTEEKHKTEYDPFKRDYYRYSCFFEDHWGAPIYKLAENTECP